MMNVVPKSDYRPFNTVFVPQRAQTGGAQHQCACICHLQRRPSRCQHSEKVSAGKEQKISLHSSNATYYAVGSRCDLLRRFASGAAVAEELPVRPLGMNFGTTASFVNAVVPFQKVRVHFSRTREP